MSNKLLPFLLCGAVILTTITPHLTTEAKKTEIQTSGNADIFPDQPNIVGTFKYGKYTRNVVGLSQWQTDIMNELGIPFKTQLYIRTINTSECGDSDGLCLTYNKRTGKTVDAGPMQINQIHGEIHKWSAKLVQQGLKEREKAQKTGDGDKVIEIRNLLYQEQVRWVYGRLTEQVNRLKLPEDRALRIQKLCVLHNGSRTKQQYGEKCKISYKILEKFYINAGFNLK